MESASTKDIKEIERRDTDKFLGHPTSSFFRQLDFIIKPLTPSAPAYVYIYLHMHRSPFP